MFFYLKTLISKQSEETFVKKDDIFSTRSSVESPTREVPKIPIQDTEFARSDCLEINIFKVQFF